jgi:hypothetical protein
MARLSLILLVLGLSACASNALPVERCAPAYQASYLSTCKLGLTLECEKGGECLPAELCDAALAEACPANRD